MFSVGTNLYTSVSEVFKKEGEGLLLEKTY